ncbi:MAG: hypothetical protein OP8BY_1244 [Candidatus Saccharicenans subterraneus]|uniref:Uncharacterized protein n=1 Tax=Candidatus Saccharicenans subterraneus TaxID=2508984 RepID=A0A3E2BPK1_9BACT|nr:MAG: hypothetical protein OP8BY_1244 [Candidatus Saccharicenans subterraneum]
MPAVGPGNPFRGQAWLRIRDGQWLPERDIQGYFGPIINNPAWRVNCSGEAFRL